MSYFQADEALERMQSRPQAPWGLAAEVEGDGDSYAFTWHKPYGACDGYSLLAGPSHEALEEVLRMNGLSVMRIEVSRAGLQALADAEGRCCVAVINLVGDETSKPSNVQVLQVSPSSRAGGMQLQKPAQPAGIMTRWDEIDRALSHNNATLGRNGLFTRR